MLDVLHSKLLISNEKAIAIASVLAFTVSSFPLASMLTWRTF